MEETQNPFKEQEQEQEQDIEENVETKEETKEELEEKSSKPEDSINNDEKYEELNNKYIRLAADFDNFRKRTATEKQELSTYAQMELLKKILAVLDTLERASEQLKDIDDSKTIKEGYGAVHKQFIDTLNKIGLVEIEALGAQFNPNEHEAVTQVETDEYEPDSVALVVQKGYKLNDKVVRPAFVGVAKNKENE